MHSQFKHGHRPAGRKSSGAYSSWRSMNQRCNSPEFHAYPRYGGRGIRICRRWESFQNFLDDMGERPPGTTLERKNNRLGYSPRNCCWASPKAQGLNRSTTRLVKAFGRTLCLKDWARVIGIPKSTLLYQIARSTPRKVLNRYRENIASNLVA